MCDGRAMITSRRTSLAVYLTRRPRCLVMARAGTRFPLALDVRYAAKSGKHLTVGSGRTSNLSSYGLTFAAARPLSAGQSLEVAVDWPVLLDGHVRMQLIVWGRVVRTSGTATEVTIHRHEFRTRSEALKAAAACG